MKFAEQLKAELDRLNVSQADGAEILGVSPRVAWQKESLLASKKQRLKNEK